jgi:hypothetical protein
VATALFGQIFAPIASLTGAAVAKSASVTAAATPSTSDTGAVAAASSVDGAIRSKRVAGLRTRAGAASAVKPDSADAGVVDTDDATPAPSAGVVSGKNSSPTASAAKAPGSAKSGRKGGAHRSADGSTRSSKGQ